MATIICSAILTAIFALVSNACYNAGRKTKKTWRNVPVYKTNSITYERKRVGWVQVRADNQGDWYMGAGFSAVFAVISLGVCIYNIF